MADPARADRLWLALAVATLWVVSAGDALEKDRAVPIRRDLSPRRASVARPRPHRVRLFRLGLLSIVVAAVASRPLPLPQRLAPDPLPQPPALPSSPPCPYPTIDALPLHTYP